MRPIVDRLLRALARCPPEGAPALACAAARALFPDARADVLVHERATGWTVAATLPRDAPDLALPPPGPHAAPPTARSVVGGDALRRLGLLNQLAAPAGSEGRALLSVARAERPFTADDAEALAAIARAAAPALATRARLARFRVALRRTRFVQRVVAAVSRSLQAEDVLRALVERLRGTLPLASATLVVQVTDGRELESLAMDERDGFAAVTTVRHAGRSRFQRLSAPLREPSLVRDLRGVDAPDEWQVHARNAGVRSLLVVPLLVRRRFVGALLLGASEPGAIRPDHVALLRHLERALAGAVERARLYGDAGERTRQMTALYEVAQALSSPVDMAGVTERVLAILHETFRFRHSAVLMLEEDASGSWLVMQASRGYSLRDDAGGFRMRVGDRGITSRAVRTGRMVYVPDVRRDPHYVQGVESGRSEVAVPLVAGGRVIGVLDVESTRVDAFPPQDLETLKLFSTQVALALERARVFEDVRRQAMTDGLTGLSNQRSFKEKVERELDRSRRTGRPFVLAMLDVDDFKRINDAHGHVAGDQALATIGEVLRGRIRSIDAAARFGGDEFALILSEADEEAGLEVVEDLRRDLRARAVPGVGPLTCSIGVAQWTPELVTFRDVVHAADTALYRAKERGKDQAVRASEPTRAGAQEGRP